ncbi:hypothetical protein CGMCC3_g11343 [Colletotrichum fructicola]|nr:uncharacterized protein CGMCC3_g11343 [Colletotrichum fructicola]KAE9572692.1 hypothetical protein CGMCC3_g11343 [Colletotrichum fructicola]
MGGKTSAIYASCALRNLLPAEEYPGADSTAPAGVPADGNVNRWVNSSHNRRVEEVLSR